MNLKSNNRDVWRYPLTKEFSINLSAISYVSVTSKTSGNQEQSSTLNRLFNVFKSEGTEYEDSTGHQRDKSRKTNKKSESEYYISDTFYINECEDYSLDKDKEMCDTCGSLQTQHCNSSMKTNAYGEISFENGNYETTPYYLRCSSQTDPGLLSDLLLKRWCLPVPNLLMVLLGGTTNEKINSSIFSGLVNAADKTNSWFITSGRHNGVSQVIGEAVHKKKSFNHEIPTIGILPWGMVNNKNNLIETKEGDGCFPAIYGHSTEIGYNLDPNHTHFLFADNGTRTNKDIFDFSRKLETRIIEESGASLVCIIIGGQGNIEQLITEVRLRVEDRLPLIVINNTKGKGAADLLSLAHDFDFSQELYRETREYCLLERKIMELSNDEESVENTMKNIEIIMSRKNKYLVKIFSMWNEKVLDRAILQGLLSSLDSIKHRSETITFSIPDLDTPDIDDCQKKTKIERQMKLAMDWDLIELAQEYIKFNFQKDQLNDFLQYAIVSHRTAFVEKLLSHGADLASFLTIRRFSHILKREKTQDILGSEKKKKKEKKILYELLSDGTYSKSKVFDDHAESALRCFDVPHDDPKLQLVRNFAHVIFRISKGAYMCPLIKRSVHCSDGGMEASFEYPAELLAMYCVLIDQHEMAKIFLQHSSTPLFLSLVCFDINKWLKNQKDRKLNITFDVKPTLKRNADDFEMIGVGILNEALDNKYSVEWTTCLLNCGRYEWGGRSVMKIADYSKACKIIAHRLVQDGIDSSWFGRIDPVESYWKIVFSIMMLLPVFMKFRKSERHKIEEIEENDTMKSSQHNKRMLFIGKASSTESAEPDDAIELNLYKKIKYFYQSPTVKFIIHNVWYIAFLLFYTYALVIKPFDGKDRRSVLGGRMSISELVVLCWALTRIPSEILEIYHTVPKTILGKVRHYFSSFWNINDVLSIVIIILAYMIRFIGYSAEEHEDRKVPDAFSRFFFAIAFICFSVRIRQALQIHEMLGPKIIMINSMLIDLFFFCAYVAIFLVAFGVSTESLITPVKRDLTRSTVFDILWRPYANIFGELGLDDLESKLTTGYCELAQARGELHKVTGEEFYCSLDDPTNYVCDQHDLCLTNKLIVFVLLALYVMISTVLMLNLLVAVFSHTYEKIAQKSDEISKWQQYELIEEIKRYPCVPAPFGVIVHFYRLVCWGMKKFNKYRREHLSCGKPKETCLGEKHLNNSPNRIRSKIFLLEHECKTRYFEKSSKVDELDDIINDLVENKTGVSGQNSAVGGTLRRSSGIRLPQRQKICSTIDEGEKKTISRVSKYDEERIRKISVREVNTDEESVRKSSGRVGDSSNSGTISSTVTSLPLLFSSPPNACEIIKSNTSPGLVMEQAVPQYKAIFFESPNLTDDDCNIIELNKGDRRSWVKKYQIKDGKPVNPVERTGYIGRGKLPRWGPNFTSVHVITRYSCMEGWVRVKEGDKMMEVLVANEEDGYLIPELKSITRESRLPHEILQLFTNECSDNVLTRLDLTLRSSVLIYRGYLPGSWNTDHSWVECEVRSYHDYEGLLNIERVEESNRYKWVEIQKDTVIANLSVYKEHVIQAYRSRDGFIGDFPST